MSWRTLVIGGIEIALHASLDLQQSYREIGGAAVMRMQSGAGVKQAHWKRLATTISGSGWIPPGLDALDFTAAMTIQCAQPRAISSASNVIVLPAARRGDTGYAPYGFAHVGDEAVGTAVAMATNTATLASVAGASAYTVCYFPEFSALVEPPDVRCDASGAVVSWELTAEEA